ncbi:MAG: tetratricopeptide repeat protein [Armatimonadota bacterium]
MKLKSPKYKSGSHTTFFICILLIVLTSAVYWQVTGFKLLSFDDTKFVTNNSHIKGLTGPNLRWAMTGSINGNWQPVIWLSYMLDAQFHGLDAGAFHLTNLILHIANTLLLLLLLYRMTGSLWKSAFVAAVFALHPLHVESVAWISERKDVLSTLFWLLTMLAYIRYAKKPSLRRYIPVPIVFALGLMAKPMLVTLPVILLLLDYWPLGRLQIKKNATQDAKTTKLKHAISETPPASLKLLVLEKAPLVLLALGASIVTILTQRSSGAMDEFNIYPLGMRAANAVFSYIVYLRKMIWPNDLIAFYPHPEGTLPVWMVLGSVILIAVLTWQAIRSHRYPYALFGWLWYLITLIPVIGLVQVGAQAMADRYTYIPMIGISIIIAWGVPDLLHNRNKPGRSVAFAAIAVIITLTVCTYRQVGYWHDDIALFSHAIDVVPNNAPAHNNLGGEYYRQGNVDAAELQFREAVRINPRFDGFQHNLASLLYEQGRYDELATCLHKALKFFPEDDQAHALLGIIYIQQSKLDLAKIHLRKAVRLKPTNSMAQGFLGGLLTRTGEIDEAIDHLSKAVELSPENENYRDGLEYAKSIKLKVD